MANLGISQINPNGNNGTKPTKNLNADGVNAGLKKVQGAYNQSSINPLLSNVGSVIRRSKLKVEQENNLAFPSDLAAHAMVFHFKKSSMMKTNIRARPTRIVKSISLPVPSQLVDAMDAQYSELELGALGGAISDLQSVGAIKDMAINTVKEAFEQGQYAAKADFNSIKQNQGIATLALTNMIRKKSDGVKVGLARFFGSVPNPHLSALFKGVGLKNHSFSWRLSPANVQESIILKNVINTFKRGMLPARTNQNLTLEMPDEVDIYIRGHNVNHGMYEFKTAVIKNVTINFAPDNIPSFYAGTGAPTHVDFKVDFLETTIHTREDYPEDTVAMSEGSNAEPTGMPMGGSGNKKGPVGKGSFATKQRHKGSTAGAVAAGDPNTRFGHKPAGAGAPNQNFVGRNPNVK